MRNLGDSRGFTVVDLCVVIVMVGFFTLLMVYLFGHDKRHHDFKTYFGFEVSDNLTNQERNIMKPLVLKRLQELREKMNSDSATVTAINNMSPAQSSEEVKARLSQLKDAERNKKTSLDHWNRAYAAAMEFRIVNRAAE